MVRFSGSELNKGYRFPAEYEPHAGTLLIWPERPGSWGIDPSDAERCFAELIRAILPSEDVWLLTSDRGRKRVSRYFDLRPGKPGVETAEFSGHQLHVAGMETDDSWARDVGPTFLVDSDRSKRLAVNWSFNAWGGEFDGLYADWAKDDAVAKSFAALLKDPVLDAAPFVLEGGSIHSDGEGTLLVTEACLCSGGRNPELTKEEIEQSLRNYLNVEKVLWLPRGIYNDETNEHVDNVAAFVGPAEVVLAWTEDTADPQYPLSLADLEYLASVTDAKGRSIKVHKLPIPKIPVCYTEDEVSRYSFEPGEDERDVGERLAASYVNFCYTNRAVLVPQFGGENTESDREAVRILKNLSGSREVIPIPARRFLLGGGNIHCLTQQIPAIRQDRA